MTKKTKAEFIEALVTKFPEIKDEVLDEFYDDLLPLQVNYFTRYTQKAIDANDRPTTLKCFHFADNCIDTVEYSVENSLAIRWAAELKFDNRDDLYALLPGKLKLIRQGLSKAYEEIRKKKQPHKVKKSKNKKR
jgi:hypothetical protein